MKQVILCIGIVLINLTSDPAFSQNLARLDQNNGFRKFKFGMTLLQFDHLEAYESTSIKLNGVKRYRYIGSDMTDLYGVKIDQLILSFYQDKLYQITIMLGNIYSKYSDSDVELINSALYSVFGNDTFGCKRTANDNILNCEIWDGKNVRLEHIRFNFSEADGSRKPQYNYISGYLLFNYKPTEKLQQQSEL